GVAEGGEEGRRPEIRRTAGLVRAGTPRPGCVPARGRPGEGGGGGLPGRFEEVAEQRLVAARAGGSAGSAGQEGTGGGHAEVLRQRVDARRREDQLVVPVRAEGEGPSPVTVR